MNSAVGSGIRLTRRPLICAWRSGVFGSTSSIVSSRSRCRFLGQRRPVLLLSQKNPSSNSNHTGFSCTEPSSRLVPTTTRIGRSASFRTAGLSANDAFLAPAIDRAGDAQRFDLNLDAAGPRPLIILLQVAVRELVDVLPAGVFRPVHHPTFDLCPAEHLLRVDQEQGDPWIALQVFEPATVGASVDPEGPVLLLEPDGDYLHRTVLAVGADDRRKDLLGEGLHLGAELHCHYTTSHLNRRVASTTVIASQMKMPSKSLRTAQREAPSTLMLRRASDT